MTTQRTDDPLAAERKAVRDIMATWPSDYASSVEREVWMNEECDAALDALIERAILVGRVRALEEVSHEVPMVTDSRVRVALADARVQLEGTP